MKGKKSAIKKEINIKNIINSQKEFFDTGKTKDINFRQEQLKKLKNAISSNYQIIVEALKEDLGKPEFEAYITEIAYLFQEIKHTIPKIRRWAKPRRVSAPFHFFPSWSRIIPEPYGTILILSPWNYPFNLSFAPLIGAIAAGNTAVIKPSELSPYSSKVISKIIGETFSPDYIAAVEGGVKKTQEILSEKFDYIFFTGSPSIGKIIMRAAALNLTPVTLELGGKSPAIVTANSSINIAAKKITWGKYLNAGQTCLAPDYLLVDENIKEELIEKIKYYINSFFGNKPRNSPDFGRIINSKHYQRLLRLLKRGKIITGGQSNSKEKFIAPTIIDELSLKDPVMNEEIFGPILPVISYKNLDDALKIVKSFPKPLALYMFTNKNDERKRILNETSSGGACINETIIHIGNFNLPFGGVGNSGFGVYHGQKGFETFSHLKSVIGKPILFDIPFRYPPYKARISLLRKILG